MLRKGSMFRATRHAIDSVLNIAHGLERFLATHLKSRRAECVLSGRQRIAHITVPLGLAEKLKEKDR
jgi:hypothetical protein